MIKILSKIKIFKNKENLDLILRLLRENFALHRKGYIIAILAMIVVAIMTALSAYIMKDVVNQLVTERNMQKIYLIAAIVMGIFFIKGLASYVQGYWMGRVGNSIVARQQEKIYDRVIQHGLEFYNEFNSGELVTRITHNAQAVRNVLNLVVTAFMRDLFTLIGLVFVMVWQQPLISIVSCIFAPIAILAVNRLVKRVKSIAKKEFLSLSEMITTLQETSTGVRIIKAFGLESYMRDRMQEAVQGVEDKANKIAYLSARTSPIMETFGGVSIGIFIIVGGTLVVQYGYNQGELMSFLTALLLAYEPAKRLARLQIGLENGMVGVKLMFDLLDRPITITEKQDAKDKGRAKGAIDFQKVKFAYRDGETVISDLELSLKPGEITALVGPSGGGKSTIMNLILRLYEPQEGTISLDGTPINDLSLAGLRRNLAYVSQDTFLFAGTIKENIQMGNLQASQSDIEEAAKAANAHEFIMRLPNGYDADIGENGAELSGGQKQRIAIARALLKDAPIILLDEATSALDTESEAKVKQAFDRLLKGRTGLVIAHRLSTIQSADKICVVKAGQIVEQGTHEGLLANKALYYDLYNMQFKDSGSLAN